MIRAVKKWYWRRKYRPGAIIRQFIAPDIRREVEVLDASRIEEGVIIGRARTWNVLYDVRGLQSQPGFGPARELEVEQLWSAAD